MFILIALGVVALWGLSSGGGFGGDSERSMWWGLLVLPYPIGWSLGIWGPNSPRWLLRLGMGVGLWHVAILALALSRPGGAASALPGMVIGGIGILTIVGCLSRLRTSLPGGK